MTTKKPSDRQKKCKAILHVGPGHQSRAECERRGPHLQHWDSNMGFYWTKQKFSVFFDDSPEDQLSDAAMKAEGKKK